MIKIENSIFCTLIKTSGCSKPASRVSIRKYVSSDAGIPLWIPGPSTRTLCGSKWGRTWTLNGLYKIYYSRKKKFFFSFQKVLPLTNWLITPININTMWSFDLWRKFSNVYTVTSRSNTCWFTTTYKTNNKFN